MDRLEKNIIAAALVCFLTLSTSIIGMAQFNQKYLGVTGITNIDELKVVHNEDEIEEQNEIGQAYSKARGATIFSTMNRINSRARRKLLEEASIRGASHVWILDQTVEGGLSRFVSYHAVFYRDKDLEVRAEQVKEVLSRGNLKPTQALKTNRNGAGLKQKMPEDQFKLDPNTIQMKGGRVMVSNMSVQGAKTGRSNRTFEVIGLNEKYIILSEEVFEGKIYEARLYEILD